MQKFFVITGTEVEDTGKISFKFMLASGAPCKEFADMSATYGFIRLKEKPSDHINIFKAVRGEPGAYGSDGEKRWEIFVFKGREQVFTTAFNEGEYDECFLLTIPEMPNCVLLMEENLFKRFEKSCGRVGAEVSVFHSGKKLKTSY